MGKKCIYSDFFFLTPARPEYFLGKNHNNNTPPPSPQVRWLFLKKISLFLQTPSEGAYLEPTSEG